MNEVVNEIIDNGFDAYIVGGYVRDYLLGFKSYDIDICTSASVDDIINIFKDEGISNKEYFSYHLDRGLYHYDITSFRKEIEYKNNKPIKLELAKNLKSDLLRRDFTINTLAIDKDGKIVDLLNAKTDLDNKIIKVVGNTYNKFNEDKTRIIRAIRFYTVLGFDFDDEIKKFMDKYSYLINEIPLMYIKKELDIIFDSNYERFFNIVNKYNLKKYLRIEYSKIKKCYDKYGIWAQLETSLPLSKKEKKIIKDIKYLINTNNISNINIYDEIVIKNINYILNNNEEYEL